MHKKTARVQTGKDGGVEVVLSLTPEIIAKAEEFATRLQVSREDVLASYFADTLTTATDAVEEYCLVAWVFPARDKAEAFIKREGLNPRQYVAEQWESGGWSVSDKAEYIVTYRQGRKAAA